MPTETANVRQLHNLSPRNTDLAILNRPVNISLSHLYTSIPTIKRHLSNRCLVLINTSYSPPHWMLNGEKLKRQRHIKPCGVDLPEFSLIPSDIEKEGVRTWLLGTSGALCVKWWMLCVGRGGQGGSLDLPHWQLNCLHLAARKCTAHLTHPCSVSSIFSKAN